MLPTVRDSLKLLSLEVLQLRLKFSFVKQNSEWNEQNICTKCEYAAERIKRRYNYCVRDCVGIRSYCWDLSRLWKVM